MLKRRRLHAEFRRGVVEQAGLPGVSYTSVAREVDIRDT